ncbi:MAG: lysophospholipid acyltransferase family protein [Opitutaceae bacterium]
MTLIADLAAGLIRLACGVRALPQSAVPDGSCIFFANHSSHLDFALIWAALPSAQRRRTRPVAGRDYWDKTAARRWIACRCFRAVLIERQKVTVASNPMEPMLAALDAGASLIVFPEGTRSLDGRLQPFKAGLYHMTKARPALPLVPIWLDNLNRILPKGEFLAVPLIASVAAGAALHFDPAESKPGFLARVQSALSALQRN